MQTIKTTPAAQLGAGDIALKASAPISLREACEAAAECRDLQLHWYEPENQLHKDDARVLLRAFFCFVAFLAIQAVWPAAAWAIGRIHNEIITR
ncbi:hypothetical protein [Pseudomonas aeruginosa]|uniref:hypothetical protein n=1 Tax=Pseudomonas aeruginosa TaxID=287 RepID=UPI00287FF3B3|nr:hypothetical protein [Pseudomonas aeruginosa]